MEKAADIASRAADDLEKAFDSVGKVTGIPEKETNLSRKSDKGWQKASACFTEANDEPFGALHA